jgi:hypothetical protein
MATVHNTTANKKQRKLRTQRRVSCGLGDFVGQLIIFEVATVENRQMSK